MMTMQQRLERLDTLRNEGRLIRNGWTARGDDGREKACLLAALSPEAGSARSPGDCPVRFAPSLALQAAAERVPLRHGGAREHITALG